MEKCKKGIKEVDNRIKDDERIVYPSIAEAGRCNNISKDKIRTSINNGKERNGHLFILVEI